MTEALIIGAGIAGPVAAMALRKAGIGAVVHEAYGTGADDVGAFLTLAANGQDALRAIEAYPQVAAVSFPARRIEVIGPDHARVADVDLTASGVAPPRTLRRATLYRVLHDEAVRRGIRIEHGRRLVAADRDVAGRVRAHFEDGSSATGDLLIGADGVHSVVRGLISAQAAQPRYIGLAIVCGYARRPVPAPAPDGYRMIYGGQAFFGYTTAPDGVTWWFARVPGPELARPELATITPDHWRRRLIEMFGDGSPAADVVAATGDEIVTSNAYDLPTLPTWHDGSMIVLGDAAHVASPASAQGASMAVEDPVMLARCLRDLPDVPTAFDVYERLRRDRVERVVAAGANTGRTKAPRRDRRPGDTDWLYKHHIEWDDPVPAP